MQTKILEALKTGVLALPTTTAIGKYGRVDITTAMHKFGGIKEVAKKLVIPYKPPHKEVGYWRDEDTLLTELLQFINSLCYYLPATASGDELRAVLLPALQAGTIAFPATYDFKVNNRRDLLEALVKYYGGITGIISKLQIPPPTKYTASRAKSVDYWKDWDNFENGLAIFINQINNFLPPTTPEKDLRDKILQALREGNLNFPDASVFDSYGRNDLRIAIMQYHGGIFQVIKKLKIKGYPRDYYRNWSNFETQNLDQGPFICTELKDDRTPCGKSFFYKSELDRHINIVHRKLKPFKCNELKNDGTPCDYSASTWSNLEQHINTVHRQIKYVCSKCGKPFSRESSRDLHERECNGISESSLKARYHMKKGLGLEDVVSGIIEQHCKQLNIPTTRQKVLFHPDPAIGRGRVDLYCEGLVGKRVAIDITTANAIENIIEKWTQRRYQDYPEVDELWVIVCSNAFDSKRCAELAGEVQKNPQYQNVHVYHWTDLRNIKMMIIPPKIWKLLEIYEMCTLKSREDCKKYWEEAKGQFQSF